MMDFDVLVDSFILRKNCSVSYGRLIRVALRGFGLDRGQNFLAMNRLLTSGLKDISKRTYVRSVKNFYDWLKAEGLCDYNPAETVKIRCRFVPRKRTLTDDEIFRYRAWAKRYDQKFHAGAELFVRLLECTGARVSSILALKVGDLDGDGYVKFQNVKCKKAYDHLLPIPERVQVLWREFSAGKKDDEALYGNGDAMYRALRARMCRSGVDKNGEHISPHSYRHTLATRMLQSGVALDVVSKVLDHASIATTLQVYAVHAQGQIDDAFKKLNAL